MRNSDMPAMPATVREYDSDGNTVEKIGGGLTKREHFASMAMQACRSRHSDYRSWSDLAKDAVDIADALLAELEKKK